MTTKNKGFITEANHFEFLKIAFDNVSEPKGSGGGSDFIAIHDDKVISFESKTSNTDVFDAGTLNCYANGFIFHASSFLCNNHIHQVEDSFKRNMHQLIDYTTAANTGVIPHTIEKDLYNQIKEDGKLIHILEKQPLSNIIEDSFAGGKNKFIKANYIIIDKSIFCISDKPELDPLDLRHHGAPILGDDDIYQYTVRTSRSGSKNGRASVTMRLQFKLNRKLPISKVRLVD